MEWRGSFRPNALADILARAGSLAADNSREARAGSLAADNSREVPAGSLAADNSREVPAGIRAADNDREVLAGILAADISCELSAESQVASSDCRSAAVFAAAIRQYLPGFRIRCRNHLSLTHCHILYKAYVNKPFTGIHVSTGQLIGIIALSNLFS